MRIGICPICGGDTVDKKVDIVDRVNERWVLICGVPAEACTQCGEKLYTENEMKRMERLREEIRNNSAKPISTEKIEVFTI